MKATNTSCKRRGLCLRLLALMLCLALVLPLSACGESKMEQKQVFAMDTIMTLTAYGKNAASGLKAAEGDPVKLAELKKKYKDELRVAKNTKLITQIQMIFQDPIASLNPRMTVKEIISEGLVINGIRDTEAILKQGFPVFLKYRTNVGMLGRFRMYYYQKPIRIGEIVINPGDWIFGDIDGAIRIPAEITLEVLEKAEALLLKEDKIRGMVNSGMKPTQVVANGGYF